MASYASNNDLQGIGTGDSVLGSHPILRELDKPLGCAAAIRISFINQVYRMEILGHFFDAKESQMIERLQTDGKRGQSDVVGHRGDNASQRDLVLAIMLRRKIVFSQKIVDFFTDRRAQAIRMNVIARKLGDADGVSLRERVILLTTATNSWESTCS